MSAQLCKDVWVFENKCELRMALGATSITIIIVVIIIITIIVIIN